MTSLLDRPTADGSGQSQPPATTAYAAAKLWQARHKMKLFKLNLICIINYTSKTRTKIWTTDLKKN